jgi:hypothetical protein
MMVYNIFKIPPTGISCGPIVTVFEEQFQSLHDEILAPSIEMSCVPTQCDSTQYDYDIAQRQ